MTKRAFTLIELLVVISIIALLIAILLPALGAARTSAKNMQCSSNIRQLVIAELAFVSDHKGEFPEARRWIWSDRTVAAPSGTFYFEAVLKDPTVEAGIVEGLIYDYVGNDPDAYLCPIASDVLTSDTFEEGWAEDRLRRNYVQNSNVGPKVPARDTWDTEELTLASMRTPSNLVVLSEENTFALPGFSVGTMNDGYLLSAAFGSPFIDCFASFHNSRDITQGDANAAFADGHVQWVNYEDPEPFTFSGSIYPFSLQSATSMFCTDSVPNRDE